MPLCDCTVYGCNTRDKTGKWWLTTYQLRQHHRTEQRQADLLKEVEEEQAEEAIRALRQQKLDVKAAEDEEKRQAARERRERKEEERNRRCHGVDEALEAIRRHDVDVTALMSQLSLSPPPSVAPRPDRNYRGDREKAQVEIWGKIMDVQDELKADLEFLTLPPPELRIGELRAGVAKIGSLAQRANVLKRHIASLQNAGRKPASVEVLIETVWMESKSLDDAIGDALKAWNESITQQLRLRTNDRASTFQTSHLHQPIFGDAFAAIQVIMFMVVVCSTVLSLSRRGCSWLLDMSCAALSEAFDMASGRSRHMDKITNTFPRDVPTVVKHFRLDTKSQVYAACPECHHIHAALRTDPLPEYQERCNYRRYNRGKKCKAVLTRPVTVSGATRMVPIKPFVSFDFRDWLARLMARKDVEEKMDRKWDHLKKDPTTMSKEELQAEAAEGLSDVFDGSFIRSFKGPDGEHHFKDASSPDEGRYLFSLGFDFFNPLTNKMAGKKLSVGAFSLVCLNLPVEERYKPENMFLAGIIPGPHEPPLDLINSYWTPLVDCFEELWHYGVYFDRTYAHKDGRLVRCAIVMLVCDLPAARKIGGFASCRHQWFCSRCLCTRDVKRGTRKSRKNRKKRAVRKDAEDRVDEEEQEKAAEVAELEAGGEDGEAGEAGEAGEGGRNTPIPEPAFEGGEGGNRVGYNDFDIKSWKLRTGSQCRVWAELYRTAPTQRDAQVRFDKTGLRWTEFLRLPYFDLPIMLVVDSMHNLFLGLLKEHFRHILGLRSNKSKKKQGDLPSVLDIVIPPSADNPRPLKPTEIKSLEKALKALSEPMTERLKNPAERKKISDLTIWKKLNQKAAIHIAKGVGCTGLYRVRPCRHADGMETEDEPLHVVTDRLIKVEDMVEKILDWRASQVEKVLEREEAPDVELITKEEKAELWSDLATMTKPSWMTSVPPQIGGESSDGKLKSDQWRTLGTVYMPVTLIRLWYASENPQRRELLDLTMDLVSAVILASSRETSRQNSEQCLKYLLSYRAKLQKLFPDYHCHPNHHMALHIPEFLLLFGPVHGWWTFPFERLIGKLQRVPTNYKPGEYEATIGHKYHRTSNLRMMSDTRTFPEALKSLTKIFDKLLRPQTRNVFLDDERSTAGSETRNVKGSPADPEIAAAFRRVADSLGSPNAMPSKVLTPSSTTYNGIRYTTNSRHKGNSSVIVAGADGTDIPMVIQTIVQDAQRPEHIFLATKRVNAMDIDDDPFEAYPVLAAKIWSHLEDLDPELDIIYPSEITSHFVSCEMEVKTVAGEPARAAVILPLRKSILLEYEEEDEEELEDADAMQL